MGALRGVIRSSDVKWLEADLIRKERRALPGWFEFEPLFKREASIDLVSRLGDTLIHRELNATSSLMRNYVWNLSQYPVQLSLGPMSLLSSKLV